MVVKIYTRVHEIGFELTDEQYETMRRTFALVRQQYRPDLTDEECLAIALERAAGSV